MRTTRRSFLSALLPLAVLFAAGCAKPPVQKTAFRWWVGREAPVFDPQGPPDAVRGSLERLLTRSLVTRDSLGAPVLDAAERVTVSDDGRVHTFHLAKDLRFLDGSPCGSEVFRDALLAALARADHGTAGWVLAAVRGAEAIRPRKPLPSLGIEASDAATLRITLVEPDSLLLDKLAIPGLTAAWKSRDAKAWKDAIGLGPYRALREDARALVLLRERGEGPDTVAIRFGAGAARARQALRAGDLDLMWPLPPAMLDQAPGAGWAVKMRPALPPRRLSLVMRADVPPTTKLAARRVLAHSIPRTEIPRRLGPGAREVGEWLPGAGRAALPGLDQAEVQAWLERGRLGRSVHVTLAYDADGAGAAVARSLQGDWARFGLYIDLRPLRGKAYEREALGGQAQALLVEESGLVAGPAGILAPAVMPLRGPAVGAFRTGWRTREFDGWLMSRRKGTAPDLEATERRLEEETIVLPLAALDWVWIEKEGGQPVSFDPFLGPGP